MVSVEVCVVSVEVCVVSVEVCVVSVVVCVVSVEVCVVVSVGLVVDCVVGLVSPEPGTSLSKIRVRDSSSAVAPFCGVVHHSWIWR